MVEDLPPWRNNTWEEVDGMEDQEDQRPSTPKLALPYGRDECHHQTFFHLHPRYICNSQRREVRGRYQVPYTPVTRTPKVDDIFIPQSRFSKASEVKQIDKDILQIQSYMLDVARPL